MYKFIGDYEDESPLVPYKYKLKIKINFGKGAKNPLEYIYFYDSGGEGMIKIDIGEKMMLVPTHYEIIKYRFIY
jgi:hypothetical protein